MNSVFDARELTKYEVLLEYNVFTGFGGTLETTRIELREGAVPKQNVPLTVPIALRDDLKKTLIEMESRGCMGNVNEPADLVSSAVDVKKGNSTLGVCRDPRELNEYMKAPKLRLSTIDDVTSKLCKSQVFIIRGAKYGFLKVKLDEDTRKLATVHTPFGRCKWLRMPFDICSAPEEFQRHVIEIIKGLEGVTAMADDLLVTGAGDTYKEALILRL